jgi:hypothetical protein
MFALTVNTVQYSTVQYRDCAISMCFSGSFSWDWYCSLTPGVIKQVPASYLAHPFYLFFPHFFIPQVPVCQNWAVPYQLLMDLGSVGAVVNTVGGVIVGLNKKTDFYTRHSVVM